MNYWQIVKRNNQEARKIADRHYNRQSPGHLEFTTPGKAIVLLGKDKKLCGYLPIPVLLDTNGMGHG